MGFDDALNKVEQGLDGATEQVKDRTPDNVDGHVDKGADAARDRLGLGGDDNKDN